MNQTSWRVRVVWTGVIVLAVIGIAATTGRAFILLFGLGASAVAQLDAGFARHQVLTFIHIVPGALFMVLGPFQFVPAIRARRLWQHPQGVPAGCGWVARRQACRVAPGLGPAVR